jgi:hypothetical protein
MSLKFVIATVLLLALAAAVWVYRGEEPLKRYVPREWQGAQSAAGGNAPAAPAAGLRKCKQGGKLLYTNDDCPKGSVEQPISGGAVTVVPGQKSADTAPAGKASGAPDLGKMMGKEAAGELRDKRIDRETGK